MDISEKLRKAMDIERLRPAELSRLSGVKEPRISEILSGKTKNPQAQTIRKLENSFPNFPSGWLLNDSIDIGSDGEKTEEVKKKSSRLSIEVEAAAIKLQWIYENSPKEFYNIDRSITGSHHELQQKKED